MKTLFVTISILMFAGVIVGQELLPKTALNCLKQADEGGHLVTFTADGSSHELGDFDGDGKDDDIILVKSAESSRTGLIVCTASRIFRAGGAFPKTSTTFHQDDLDFLSEDWEVVPKKDWKRVVLDRRGKSPIRGQNNGAIIAFYFEGGAAAIFWDGVSLRLLFGG
jgi:hypothetical protein